MLTVAGVVASRSATGAVIGARVVSKCDMSTDCMSSGSLTAGALVLLHSTGSSMATVPLSAS